MEIDRVQRYQGLHDHEPTELVHGPAEGREEGGVERVKYT